MSAHNNSFSKHESITVTLSASSSSSSSSSTHLVKKNKGGRWRRRRTLILTTFFFAISFGFILNIFTYESLNFEQIGFAFQHLPKQWDELSLWRKQGQPLYGFVANATVAEWDKPQLLNLPTPFKWLLNNESLCKLNRQQESKQTAIVPVLVHTARPHFSERRAIRHSWGSYNSSYSLQNNLIIRPIFLLGDKDPPDNAEYRELTEEQNKFGDLVMGNFVDTYRNLSYKHLMGYKWILNFCQNAEFVMKVDDDAFIDVIQWLEWRRADVEKQVVVAPPSLYCYTYGGAKPRRNPSDKWFVPEELYSDNFYPDYCMGGGYAMTVEYIRKIYAISNFARFFWVDDVFATGILREVARQWFKYDPDIRHIWQGATRGDKDFRQYCDEGGNYLEETRYFKALVFVQRGESFERLMKCMWNKVLFDYNYKMKAAN